MGWGHGDGNGPSTAVRLGLPQWLAARATSEVATAVLVAACDAI